MRRTVSLHHAVCCVFVALLMVTTVRDVRGAAALLSAQIVHVVPRSRTASPILVDVALDYSGTPFLRGSLRFTFRNQSELIGEVETAPFMLSGGLATYRVTLPSMSVDFAEMNVETQLHFITEDDAIDLGQHFLSVPSQGQRSLVLAVCDPWDRGGRRHSELLRSLALERFSPKGEVGGG